MKWPLRVLLWLSAMVVASFLLDQLAWTLRGSPVRHVDVSVITTMELKNHKEDYGPSETETLTCEETLLPFPASGGWMEPCWWVERHREVIRRY